MSMPPLSDRHACGPLPDAHKPLTACRTIADHVKFVPYGQSVNNDPGRIQYILNMKGYCKTTLLPCFEIYERTIGALPKHLQEVTYQIFSSQGPP